MPTIKYDSTRKGDEYLARLAKFSNPAEVAAIAAEIGVGAAESAIAKAIADARGFRPF